jgi:Dyp-type peroxidase family
VVKRFVEDNVRQQEPILAIDNIQGHILSAFAKLHEIHVFIQCRSAMGLALLLNKIKPKVTSMSDVLISKGRLRRSDVPSRIIHEPFVHVALSFDALSLLDEGTSLFIDEAFQQGMSARSIDVLRDPSDAESIGHHVHWLFGGSENPVEIVVIFAGDDKGTLEQNLQGFQAAIYRIEEELQHEHGRERAIAISHVEHLGVLPGGLHDREHFGFRDLISQPGVRGRLSSEADAFLTPSLNTLDSDEGLPGQDLIWPGEFVFGYPRQDRFGDHAASMGPDSLNEARKVRKNEQTNTPAAPHWARDGSFMVVRRLAQNVEKFDRFLNENAAALSMSPQLLAAKLMGRWRSGAPIVLTPDDRDDNGLGANNLRNNDFSYSQTDPFGFRCPFGAHIRKTFPRDDSGTASNTLLSSSGEPYLPGDFRDVPPIGPITSQTHRILRRGIPYGPPFLPSKTSDATDRGLMFVCFQTSIVSQFEFVTRWMNSPDFKDKAVDGSIQTGHDMVVGQSNAAGRCRSMRIRLATQDGTIHDHIISTTEEWVVPTGGGYFFSPSLRALDFLTRRLERGRELARIDLQLRAVPKGRRQSSG